MCAQHEMSVVFSFFLFISTAQEELQTCQVCRLRAKKPPCEFSKCKRHLLFSVNYFCFVLFFEGGVFPVSEVDKVS